MNIGRHKKDDFDGVINMSSDIRKNKRALIGKFDLKDLVFIGMAIVVWVVLSTIFIIFANEDLIPLYTVLLLVTILPIMYVGFRKKIDIPMLDYMIMNYRSRNTSFRTQIDIKKRIKKQNQKYVSSIEIINSISLSDDELISKIINELKEILKIENMQIIYCDKIYIIMEIKIDEGFCIIPIYDYLKAHTDVIRVRSVDEIISFNNNLIQEKRMFKMKNKNKRDSEDSGELITKVYKVMLYKEKIDFNYIKSIMQFGIVIKYIEKDEYNTFIIIKGMKSEIEDKEKKVIELCKKYYIVICELNENRFIMDAISINMNSRY